MMWAPSRAQRLLEPVSSPVGGRKGFWEFVRLQGITDWPAARAEAGHGADMRLAGGPRDTGGGRCQVPVALEPWEYDRDT